MRFTWFICFYLFHFFFFLLLVLVKGIFILNYQYLIQISNHHIMFYILRSLKNINNINLNYT